MKRHPLLLVVFLFIGLIAGSLVAHLLAPYAALSFLTKTTGISWHPKADFDFLRYDFMIQVKLSLLSLLGAACAVWLYRK